jgi:hypothetical protein
VDQRGGDGLYRPAIRLASQKAHGTGAVRGALF